MGNPEIRQKLENHFKDSNVEVILYPSSCQKTFADIEAFNKFIEQECEFWNACTEGYLNDVQKHFKKIQQQIRDAINSGNENEARSSLKHAIESAKRNNKPSVYSQTPEAQFLLEQYKISFQRADGAYDFLINGSSGNLEKSNHINSKEFLSGLFSSFIFQHLKESFQNSTKAEEQSLETLKSSFIKSKDELEHYFATKSADLDAITKKFQDELLRWKQETIDAYKQNLDQTTKDFQNLKALYVEEMRLRGPAKYWNELYSEYQKKGRVWICCASILSFALVVILLWVLYDFPACFTLTEKGFTLVTLKGTIILTLLISVLIYIIRLCVKLSISAYHLSRDARERHQLTHLYLSLVKDSNVAKEEREIILQALFSRADTGLLKGESGPTMPSAISSIQSNFTGSH